MRNLPVWFTSLNGYAERVHGATGSRHDLQFRVNDNLFEGYNLTQPSITFNHGKTEDFTTTNAQILLDYTEHESGSVGTYTITDSDYLTLTIASGTGDYYVDNDDVFGVFTFSHPYITFRYKSTGPSARIVAVFSDSQTQEVLAESAASAWTTVTVALTALKTLNKLQFYA